MAIYLDPVPRDSTLIYVLATLDPFAATCAAESLESFDDRKEGTSALDEG